MYGLVIMLIALGTHIIKLEQVKEAAEFLIEIMPVMFIPTGVGLLTAWGVLKPVCMPISLITYEAGLLLKRKFKMAIFNPLLIAIIAVMAVLSLLHIDYDTYNQSGQYISYLLTPATVCLAVPLYQQIELGGIVTITVAVIIITGVLGNMIAETVIKLAHIEEPIAKGLALETSAHAIGTAKAMELGEVEGAMSSLAIAVAGLLTVVGASVFAQFM
nr:LrgB family protein [uncultured Blautia sp.]